jgi:hypothetical protein
MVKVVRVGSLVGKALAEHRRSLSSVMGERKQKKKQRKYIDTWRQ